MGSVVTMKMHENKNKEWLHRRRKWISSGYLNLLKKTSWQYNMKPVMAWKEQIWNDSFLSFTVKKLGGPKCHLQVIGSKSREGSRFSCSGNKTVELTAVG